MKFGPVVQEEMLFKDISYLELWRPFCSAERNHLCNFSREYYEEQFCEIVLNLDQWFIRKCHFKIVRIRSAGGFFVQQGGTIWPMVQKMSFKDISYLELWWPFCSAERTYLCNFGRGHYEEQFYEFILNLGQWFRRSSLKDFLSGALAALLFSGAELLTQFWKRSSWGHSCEGIWNLDQWFRRRCRLKKKFTHGRMTDGRRTKSDYNTSPWAFSFMYCWVLIFALSPFYILIYMF